MTRSDKQPPMKQGSPHDFQTDDKMPVDILSKYLNKESVIWECAAGKGLMANNFRNNDFKVIETDLLTGQDFLMYSPPECDLIITNPPFDLKNQFIERAYIIGKPFAFLLPLTSFEGKQRQPLFREFGLQVIFLPRRVNFITPSGKGGGAWFATAWFTNWLNLPKDIIFEFET
jgi:hypothetical protein